MPQDLVRSEAVLVVVGVSLDLEGDCASRGVPGAEAVDTLVDLLSVIINPNLLPL